MVDYHLSQVILVPESSQEDDRSDFDFIDDVEQLQMRAIT